MPRNKSNSIRIFWIENNTEKSVRIYPKNLPQKKWENSWDLYLTGLTAVCNYFNCLTPEEMEVPYKWCFDWLPYAEIHSDWTWDKKKAIYESEEYQQWLEMKIQTWACECTDSMFSDAYTYLIEACKHHNNKEDVDVVDLQCKKWKEAFWINYLFNEYLGNQKSRVDTGAWVFKDGSYITVDSGNHRRIIEEYMNLKEREMERQWVKISLYMAYTHNRMTDAQKKTLNKFFKQYPELHERNINE